MEQRLAGGVGEAQPSNEQIQSLVDALRDDIHTKAGKQFPTLKALSYKSQVVAGTNYFVKVHTGDEHIHLRIFKPLPFNGPNPELHGVQMNHSVDSPIDYF